MRATRTRLVSFFCFLLLFFSFPMLSQNIEVVGGNNPPYTPQNLVENILLGNGVNIISTSFEGDAKAVGYFTTGAANIGLERGLVMSTGKVEDGAKPNNYPTTDPDAFSQTSGSTVADADLLALTNGGGLQDIAKYEITFEPFGDNLQFRYVFASEEYPTFACYNYNDVFGFFVTGPNPSGGTYNAKNIALVPGGGNMEVSINSVHDGNPFIPDQSLCAPINEQYYNDNIGSPNLAYNAFLDIFTATIDVVPCATYTIKLAIGDGSLSGTDDNFDSAVFLEAKSFETSSLEVEAVTVSLDGSIIEGCSQGSLNFTLPIPAPSDYPLNFNITGTATNGVDYQTIPTSLSIPAGTNSISLPIIADQDNMIEGSESLIIEVIISPCKRDTFTFYIKDNILTTPDLGKDSTICIGESVQLDGDLSIASIPPQSFTSGTGSIPDKNPNPFSSSVFSLSSPITVSAVDPPTIVEGLIQSVCMDITHAEDEDLDISLVSPSGQFIELSTDNGGQAGGYTKTCFTPTAVQSILGNGDPAPSSMVPFTGSFLPEGIWSDLWDGNNPSNGTWNLVIVDDELNQSGSLQEWSITFNSLYEVSYSWSPAAGLSCTDCPNPVASPATTTTYTLTVNDTYGCQTQDEITITVEGALAAPTITCATSTSSSVSFNWPDVPNATAYEVNINGTGWLSPNDGARSHIATGFNLNETVNIQVRGVGDCGTNIASTTCTTSNCSPPTTLVAISKAISCFEESDANIEVTGMSGTAPFTYTLGSVTNTTGMFSSLNASKHYITIADANGCSTVDSIQISAPDKLVLTGSSKAESCAGQKNGEASVSVIGGTGPYTYQWGPTTGDQTTATANGLEGGSYAVQVTDASGCSESTSVSVSGGGSFTINVTKQDPKCAGATDGSANVNITGGTAPFTYAWNDINSTTTAQISTIGVGDYTVVVTDASGCSTSGMASLMAPSSLAVGVSNATASCFDSPDGEINLSVSDGAPPYTYQWSDMGAAIASRKDLVPGEYLVTITDQTGCGTIEKVEVFGPLMIEVQFMASPLSCFESGDGMVTAVASGGSGGFMYKWNDTNGQTNGTAINLDAGMITVTATDASGCVKIDSVEIIQPEEIEITPTPEDTKCNGASDGSISLVVSGGAGTYTYSWNDPNNQITSKAIGLAAGAYDVIVTDADGCSNTNNSSVGEPNSIASSTSVVKLSCGGTNGNSVEASAFGGSGNYNYVWSDATNQRSRVATNLGEGKFYVSITDTQGCEQIDSIEIIAPQAISLSLLVEETSCFGGNDGRITGIAGGGTGMLSFNWDNESISEVLTGLSANEYCVTVTDENGCSESACTTVGQPDEIKPNEKITYINCKGNNNGEIRLLPSGGLGPYTYLWSGPNSFSSTDEDIASLEPGDYSVVITDSEGCNLTKVIKMPEPSELLVRFTTESVDCFGESTGHILAEAIGGNAPYKYDWGGGLFTNELSDLPAGDYQLTVTDNFGCSFEKSTTLTEPDTSLNAEFQVGQISCAEKHDGQVIFNATGGTPNYNYSIDGVVFSPYPTAFGLEDGIYDLYIRDANGCTIDSLGVEIIEPVPVEVDLGNNVNLSLGEDLMLEADIQNAEGSNMIYQWNSEIPNSLSCEDCPTPLLSTFFTTAIGLTVIDENGCIGKDHLQVIVNKEREVLVPSGFTPNGDSNNDLLQVHGKGGTKVVNFRVYDRWGELLFEASDFNTNSDDQGWDGRFRNQNMPTGIYIWKAEVEFIDGYTEIYAGETTLIR